MSDEQQHDLISLISRSRHTRLNAERVLAENERLLLRSREVLTRASEALAKAQAIVDGPAGAAEAGTDRQRASVRQPGRANIAS